MSVKAHARSLCASIRDLRMAKSCISTPEQKRDKDGEERMCAQVRCKCKICIKGRSANLLLKPGQIRGLETDNGEDHLSRLISPVGERLAVYPSEKA